MKLSRIEGKVDLGIAIKSKVRYSKKEREEEEQQ